MVKRIDTLTLTGAGILLPSVVTALGANYLKDAYPCGMEVMGHLVTSSDVYSVSGGVLLLGIVSVVGGTIYNIYQNGQEAKKSLNL
jgi:hypothetical protein